MKNSLNSLLAKRNSGEKISWITAYDYMSAKAAEEADIDLILVGDSGGMVNLGYSSTNPVDMAEMLSFCKAVKRGAPDTFIVGDMPFGSYEISNEEAVKNAILLLKEGGVDAIKLEGGERIAPRIKAISDAGIIVFAHLGLTPQSANSFGGYRVQGKTLDSFNQIVEDSITIQEAGASFLLLEAIPETPAHMIKENLDIPVYGIGAGAKLDGQLIIFNDLVGNYSDFRPKFAKCFVKTIIQDYLDEQNEVSDTSNGGKFKDGVFWINTLCIKEYARQVKSSGFPTPEECYNLKAIELQALRTSKYWKNL